MLPAFFQDIAQNTYAEIHRFLNALPALSEPRLAEVTRSYLRHPGKALRPVLLILACRAFGGREEVALPAAAAVEMFHTWTLMHDDVIDHDPIRRGTPTAHVLGTAIGREQLHLEGPAAEEYGKTLAILAGDTLHAAALAKLAQVPAPADLTLSLLQEMDGRLAMDLLSGEQWDVTLSAMPFEHITEEQLHQMMRGKTGALLAFAAETGVALGEQRPARESANAKALGSFAMHCGIAFQLQDDILGVFGNETQFGKPVGSDIREGKRTLLALHAFRQGTPSQRATLQSLLGKGNATPEEIAAVRAIFQETGALATIQRRAEAEIASAQAILQGLSLPDEKLAPLRQWASLMTHRAV